MALTIDWAARIIDSSTSIVDLPAFHAELRDAEDSADGMLYPVTHTWKALDLGGGATLYQADLVNGWRLRFPAAGSYEIRGNLNGTILPVAGVYVERRTSVAFVTTSVGASGVTPEDVWSHPARSLTSEVLADVQAIRGQRIAGSGTGLDPWRPA